MKRFYALICLLLLFPILSINGQDTWEQQTSIPGAGRYAHASFVIGDIVYMGTGNDETGYLSDWWMYDTRSKVWTKKGDFPGGARTAATGFAIGNKGYLCFGSNTPGDENWIWYKDLWQYNPEDDSWVKLQDFPGHERYLAVSFVINGKAYVGTGNYRYSRWTTATYLNDFWEYDPVTDHWTERARVPEQGRASAMGLAVRDKGYIGFGFYYYDTRKNDWWQYDPTSNTWTRKADLPATPRYKPSGFTVDDKAFVIGGAYYGALYDNWAYDPQTDSWSQKASFPGIPRYEALSFSIGNKGYYGLGAYNDSYDDLWKYSGELITLVCPANKELYLSNTDNCSKLVDGIDPVYFPTTVDHAIAYQHLWNGTLLHEGSGSASNTQFPVGENVLIYTLPYENNVSCTTSINVLDTIPPTVLPIPDQVNCYLSTNSYVVPKLIVSDNCSIDPATGVVFTISGATNRSGLGVNASGLFVPGLSNIRWSVTDSSGNTTVMNTRVFVGRPISVTVPAVPSVLFGAPNTVYIGYGFGGIVVSAQTIGGNPLPNNTFKYSWSNGATTRSAILRPPSTPGNYQYSVKVTDALGCTATAVVMITVKDIRCGNQGNKVWICRTTRQGSKDFCVSQNEATIALFNGAKLGQCEVLASPNSSNSLFEDEALVFVPTIRISPNPNRGSFILSFAGFEPDVYTIQVMDMRGKLIKVLQVKLMTNYYTLPLDLSSVAKGTLMIRVTNKKAVWTEKVLVQ